MDYKISLQTVAACPTAVVAQATTWEEFPRLWARLLDEVYAFLRGGGAAQDGQNVMLYRDDLPNVEVGVQVAGPFTPSGRVIPSSLPAGKVATTVHRGPHDGLDAAHQAVLRWCGARGHQIQGTRWEIYGDWRDDPAELETQVSLPDPLTHATADRRRGLGQAAPVLAYRAPVGFAQVVTGGQLLLPVL